MSRGSPLSSLPVDPVNTVASGAFYVFVTDGRTWGFASLLESERHAPSAVRDGGTDSARFEAGTNPSLWASASGLVGYWSFDGTGSIANNQIAGLRDESGRGNHGTASNANATGMAFVPGRVGNAVTFDGVDDFVSSPDSATLGSIFGTEIFTLEAWAFPRDWVNWRSIINKSNSGWHSAQPAGLFADMDGFSVRIGQGIDAGGQNVVAFMPAALNQWYHVVGVANGSILQLYVNGVLRGSVAITMNPPTNNDPLMIGRFVGQLGSFNGLIDEVRIHNRALTEAEIRATFNATR